MKGLRIGDFDRKITIQEEVITTNLTNESIRNWKDKVSVWAKVVNRMGHEQYMADQLTAVQTTQFYIRYRSDLDVKMRIEHEGTIYLITSITEPQGFRRSLLEIKGEILPEE